MFLGEVPLQDEAGNLRSHLARMVTRRPQRTERMLEYVRRWSASREVFKGFMGAMYPSLSMARQLYKRTLEIDGQFTLLPGDNTVDLEVFFSKVSFLLERRTLLAVAAFRLHLNEQGFIESFDVLPIHPEPIIPL